MKGVAALAGAAFLALAISVLALGYPHEDAYILFKYARHVGAGLGSVFSPGGPHAEGATDFLWMMALGGGAKLGIDPAVSAAVLNAVGFGLVVRRVHGFVREASPSSTAAVTAFVGALLLVHPFSAAGALGFSATLYAAIALELYVALASGALAHIPWLALLLGLFRPDGVVLGGAAAVIAIARSARQAGPQRSRVLGGAAIAFVIAAAYFVLRWRYFGSVLPLPLIVKSHFEGRAPGIGETLDWCASTVLPTLGMLIGFRILLGPLGLTAPGARARLVALVPPVVHVLAFAPSFPSQNVAGRFQSPDALVLYLFALVTGLTLATGRRRIVVVAGFAAATYFQGFVGVRAMGEAFARDYVDPFSVTLGRIADERAASGASPLRVASTEAGRVLYWTHGPVLDLVGLNSPETASVPPSRAVLARFDPDVIMFHHASGFDEDAMERGHEGQVVFPLAGPLARFVRPWNARFLAPELPPYDVLHVDNVRAAPIATAAFIDDHARTYELWASRFVARFARFHVYAIRADLPEKESIVRALEAAHDPLAHGSHLTATRR